MKTFKLFGRFVKKHWLLFVITVLMIIFLNYIRSIVPKLTGVIVAIVGNNPIEESELPTFFLPLFANADTMQARLIIIGCLIASIALVREVINVFSDVNIYRLSELVGCDAQIAYFEKVQNLPYTYLNHACPSTCQKLNFKYSNRYHSKISVPCSSTL